MPICDLKGKNDSVEGKLMFIFQVLRVKPKRPSYIYDKAHLSETLNCRYPRQIALHMDFIHYDNLYNPFSAL